ncbi:MAG: hypothetical protein ACRC92_24005 [Peptostreptococcaceae bacterium]
MKLISKAGFLLCELYKAEEDNCGLVGLDTNARYKEYTVVVENADGIDIGDRVVAQGNMLPETINGKEYYVIELCDVIALLTKEEEECDK